MSTPSSTPGQRPDTEAQAVLDFWFLPPDHSGHGRSRHEWFKKDDAFDASIRERFGPLIDRALAGELAGWWSAEQPPLQALAAILVLDQFTRNTGRGSPRSFAGDAQALSAAQALVARGADRSLSGVQRQFCYLPFEHAEDLALQERSMALFSQLAQDHPALADLLEWARNHQVIIERFGRFPHRNAVLGRESTPEEREFLKQPGSGF